MDLAASGFEKKGGVSLVDQPVLTTTELIEVKFATNIIPGSQEAGGKFKLTLSPPIKRRFTHLTRVTKELEL